MTINNVAIYAEVANRVRHLIEDTMEAATPFYPALALEIESDQESEDYDWLGKFPGVREWLGDRKFKELSSYSFTITNKTWEQSLAMDKDKMDDGKTRYFDQLAIGMANEAAYHKDELLIELINDAGAVRCFDGQYFFDTDHEMGESGVQSNLVTREVVDSADPTGEEIRQIVILTMDTFLTFKGDNGKSLHRPTVKPIDDLLVAVPSTWYSRTVEAFAAKTRLSGGAAVDNYNIVTPQIVGVQGMTSAIDVYRTGGTLKPFVVQDREMFSTQTKGADDIEFKHVKVMGKARYNVGVLAWWTAVRNVLEDAA